MVDASSPPSITAEGLSALGGAMVLLLVCAGGYGGWSENKAGAICCNVLVHTSYSISLDFTKIEISLANLQNTDMVDRQTRTSFFDMHGDVAMVERPSLLQ